MSQHNLPSQLTPFVGRSQEIAEIAVQLNKEDCRLLTLVGPGGVGKTRLALAIGETQISNITDGVWLVRLQPVATTDWIVPTIAEAIGFSFKGAEEPHQQLLSYLSNKAMLLLLDNFEQLLDENGLHLLTDILEAAPSVKLLITSREALNLQEEWRFSISGLSTPSVDIDNNSDLEAYEAIQLFITCAYRVNPHFNLFDERDSIARVCQLVEGMPLAIEMATSWLSSLSCQDIATKIEQGLLDTRLRNVPERHRSISAVLEQSWQLLNENERDIFCKLSVFAGGFRREATEAIADAGAYELAALVDKSLLQLDSSGRYWIHELTRQFATEKLDHFPEKKAAILDLHCEYYATFLQQREQRFRIEQSPEIIKELEEEIGNFRAAWNRALERKKIVQIRQAIWCMTEFYDFRGWFYEGENLLGQAVQVLFALEHDDIQQAALGLALAGQGNFLHYLGQIERAKSLMRQGIAVLIPLNRLRETAHAMSLLSRLYYTTGDLDEAEKSYRESVALATEIQDLVTMAFGFLNLGFIIGSLGRNHEAKQLLQDGLDHFRKINHRLGIAINLDALGGLASEMGEYQHAQQYYQDAFNYLAELDSRWHLSLNYERRAGLAYALGNYDQAEQLLRESLKLSEEVNDPRRISSCYASLADIYCVLQDFEQASQCFWKALKLGREATQRLLEARCLRGLGRIAYHREEYTQANKYLIESLTIYQESNMKSGIAQVYNELGRVSVHLDKESDALGYFYEALQISVESEIIPLILDTLVSIAELIASRNDPVNATELLTFSAYHSACHAATKAQIERLLNKLEKLLPLDEFVAARKRGQQYKLEDMVHYRTLALNASQTNALTESNRSLPEPLTRRELAVLKLILEGYTNREIAQRLYISVNTVKKHINHIFGKLDVKNRTQAIAKTRQLNILP